MFHIWLVTNMSIVTVKGHWLGVFNLLRFDHTPKTKRLSALHSFLWGWPSLQVSRV